MNKPLLHRLGKLLGIGLALWLGLGYLLPVTAPFLLGGLLALAAEPGVRLLHRRLRFPRPVAVGLCVSLTLLTLTALISVLAAIVLRELGTLAKMAPALGESIGQGLGVLEDHLLTAADKAPDSLRPVLIQTVLNTFQDGTALIEQVTGRLPSAVASLVGWFSRSALTLGTGVIAGFMVSVRLPRLKAWVSGKLPETFSRQALPALKRLKTTLGQYLFAQVKLMAVTFLVVTLGFWLTGIGAAPLWAGVVALVDAVPVLGTGTVLIPWSVIRFLQGDALQGLGLLITYAAALVIRSALEPRVVGRSLGIDPLLSLGAFYVGFRLWGIPGMILAPMSVALGKGIAEQFTNNS